MLIHMCWDCAAKLGKSDSLCPGPGPRRPCPYCGEQEIGMDFGPDGRARVLPTCIQWPSHCWPIAFGNALRRLVGLPAESGLW